VHVLYKARKENGQKTANVYSDDTLSKESDRKNKIKYKNLYTSWKNANFNLSNIKFPQNSLKKDLEGIPRYSLHPADLPITHSACQLGPDDVAILYCAAMSDFNDFNNIKIREENYIPLLCLSPPQLPVSCVCVSPSKLCVSLSV